MKKKQLIIILTATFIISTSFNTIAGQKKETLKIYLPREITVNDSHPTLGQVAIIRGTETLLPKANDIGLGHLSTPEQILVIDRNTVLSRLASNGISASNVTLTGAKEMHIKREHLLIPSSRMTEEALHFLKNNLPDPSICGIETVRPPADVILPGVNENITFTCHLIPQNTRNQCKVSVITFQNGQKVGSEEVTFQFRYQCRKTVTKTPIAKGEVINKENTLIEDGVSNYPEPAGWSAPYGLIATRSLPAKTVITQNMIASPKPQVVLKRNQSVSIKIENAGLIATATGKALQDGIAGEYIKVQNIDSKVIIMAKVNEDGSVEPAL